MSVIIRPAESDDLVAIQLIYAHHVLHGTATFELEPPDLAEMTTRYQALRDTGFPFLAAELGGLVVGYGYAGPYRTRPAYRHTVEDSIYLHPSHCGQGIGRRLLARLIDECAQQDLKQMVAVIGDSANAASIRLHQQAGFRDVGTFRAVGYKFNRWLDTVLMQRALEK